MARKTIEAEVTLKAGGISLALEELAALAGRVRVLERRPTRDEFEAMEGRIDAARNQAGRAEELSKKPAAELLEPLLENERNLQARIEDLQADLEPRVRQLDERSIVAAEMRTRLLARAEDLADRTSELEAKLEGLRDSALRTDVGIEDRLTALEGERLLAAGVRLGEIPIDTAARLRALEAKAQLHDGGLADRISDLETWRETAARDWLAGVERRERERVIPRLESLELLRGDVDGWAGRTRKLEAGLGAATEATASALAHLRARIEPLERLFSARPDLQAELEGRIGRLELGSDAHEPRLDSLDERVAELGEQSEITRKRVDLIPDPRGRISSLEKKVEGSIFRPADVEKRISALEGDAGKRGRPIGGLEVRLDALESSRATTSELSLLRARVNILDRTSATQEGVRAMEERLRGCAAAGEVQELREDAGKRGRPGLALEVARGVSAELGVLKPEIGKRLGKLEEEVAQQKRLRTIRWTRIRSLETAIRGAGGRPTGLEERVSSLEDGLRPGIDAGARERIDAWAREVDRLRTEVEHQGVELGIQGETTDRLSSEGSARDDEGRPADPPPFTLPSGVRVDVAAENAARAGQAGIRLGPGPKVEDPGGIERTKDLARVDEELAEEVDADLPEAPLGERLLEAERRLRGESVRQTAGQRSAAAGADLAADWRKAVQEDPVGKGFPSAPEKGPPERIGSGEYVEEKAGPRDVDTGDLPDPEAPLGVQLRGLALELDRRERVSGNLVELSDRWVRQLVIRLGMLASVGDGLAGLARKGLPSIAGREVPVGKTFSTSTAPSAKSAEIEAIASYLEQLGANLEAGARRGTFPDEPEGSRWLQVSDTLAKQITTTLREKASSLRALAGFVRTCI